jgi:hypothetical protein
MAILVRSVTSTTFENRMGELITRSLNDGWELMIPPIFTVERVPSDMNPAVVGKYPFFLLLFKKNAE